MKVKIRAFGLFNVCTLDEEDSLDLYCHGSLRYQASTTVEEGSGADTGASKLGLVCRNGRFVAAVDEVRTEKC